MSRETKQHHQAADNDRLAILHAPADTVVYTEFLRRVYGFEAPIEAALLTVNALDEWIDLRDRAHLRLLRADLQSLGISEHGELTRCTTIAPLSHPAEALGWMYAVDRNALVHDVIQRHLHEQMPSVLRSAGAYVAGRQRSNGHRLRSLGAAMDRLARDATMPERMVAAANAAFLAQRDWYDVADRLESCVA